MEIVIMLLERRPTIWILGLGKSSRRSTQFSLHSCSTSEMVLSNDYDLLNPPTEVDKRNHKLERLVQVTNSFSMDVILLSTVTIGDSAMPAHQQSHRLTEGCSFLRKKDGQNANRKCVPQSIELSWCYCNGLADCYIL